MNEYRIIRTIQDKLLKNTAEVYNPKVKNGDKTKLAKRCNDFLTLKGACRRYK